MWKFFIKCKDEVFSVYADSIENDCDEKLQLIKGKTCVIAEFKEWTYWYKEKVVDEAEPS